MTRGTPALRPPTTDLHSFPSTERKTASSHLYRSHRAGRAPWHFDDTLGPAGGRFNLPAPRGTCYAADDLATAVREGLGSVLGQTNVIEEDLAVSRVVSRIAVAGTLHVAELNNPNAVRHGANRELSASTDYPTTQKWAATLADAGFGALHYESRFTTKAAPTAWALFGPLPETMMLWDSRHDVPGHQACRRCGIEILPAMLDDASARVIDPPGDTTAAGRQPRCGWPAGS